MKFLLPIVLVLTLISLAQSTFECGDKRGAYKYKDCPAMFMCHADGKAQPLNALGDCKEGEQYDLKQSKCVPAENCSGDVVKAFG